MRRYFILTTKKCRIYAAFGVSQTPTDEKISKGDKQLRKKREYFLNSPVNFIYVTKDENIAILDEKIADYTKRITNYASKSLLGLIGEFDTSTEEMCRKILSNRYDDIYGKVMDHIQILIP